MKYYNELTITEKVNLHSNISFKKLIIQIRENLRFFNYEFRNQNSKLPGLTNY